MSKQRNKKREMLTVRIADPNYLSDKEKNARDNHIHDAIEVALDHLENEFGVKVACYCEIELDPCDDGWPVGFLYRRPLKVATKMNQTKGVILSGRVIPVGEFNSRENNRKRLLK
jgi:hypothetical protein